MTKKVTTFGPEKATKKVAELPKTLPDQVNASVRLSTDFKSVMTRDASGNPIS